MAVPQRSNVLLSAVILCAAWFFQANEAARLDRMFSRRSLLAYELRAKSRLALRMEWRMIAKRNKKAINAIKAKMTTEKALDIMPKCNGTDSRLLSLVQETLGKKHRLRRRNQKVQDEVSHQASSSHRSPASAPPPASQGNSQSDYSGGVTQALERLNDMMLETINKHDFEQIRCKSFVEAQTIFLNEVSEDIKVVETSAEDANARRTASGIDTRKYEDQSEKMDDEIKQHRASCAQEESELQHQLTVANGDLGVMFKVLDMTKCKPGSAALIQTEEQASLANPNAELLQCTDTTTGQKYMKIAIENQELRKEFAKMKHPKVVQLLGQVLGSQPMEATTRPDPEMAVEKCSLANSSKCSDLRERFLNIQGGVEDTVLQIKHFIANLDTRCSHLESLLLAEKKHYVQNAERQRDLESRLLALEQEFRIQLHDKRRVYSTAEKELAAEQQKCTELLTEYNEQHCALGKIRGELMNMDQISDHLTDCVVSEWVPEECSVTCGGGVRQMVRHVSVHNDGGHKCPAVEAQQPCNQERCPVDCVLRDWTGWSACSAFCDGGVEERTRFIEVHATPGGMPCGATTDTNNCAIDACNADCQLEDWSEWTTTCTKVCGSGRQTRFKHLRKPAIGDGTCPAFHSEKRFGAKPCNTQACDFDTSKQIVCDATLDIVLLLDGSGSLGQESFDRIKAAAVEFTKAMGSNVRIGALVFSGPSPERTDAPGWHENWEVCSGEASMPADVTNPLDLCGMKWASRLTTDKAEVETNLKSAAYPGYHTFTSMGLLLAAAELSKGRSYANSLIITFTDGAPSWPLRTEMVANQVKEKARLMWVPIGLGELATESFSHLASEPVEDNIVNVLNVQDVGSRETIDKMIANFCPLITFTE